MCGIAGYVNHSFQNSKADSKAFERMALQMKNRGPDDGGYYLESEAIAGHFSGDFTVENTKGTLPFFPENVVSPLICMVHRRLSIIDLSNASHQPMESQDGRYVICFNGEIYNYRDLSFLLKSKNVTLKTDGDTEVILELYVIFGESFLDFLNGDFAFSIWDKEEKSIFCARDRIGIKPFFYVRNAGYFLFASDIKTLIASGIYEPKINYDGLFLSMAFGIAPRPLTAFDGVVALEGGECIKVFSNGSFTSRKYWALPSNKVNKKLSFSSEKKKFEELLDESVKLRMAADVEVGSFMSGGVDSTTITALAAGYNPCIKAFTLGYDESIGRLDEVEQAKEAAKKTKVDHVVVRIDPIDYISKIYKVAEGYEEPFYSISPNYLISEIVAKKNVKVVLNGLGGDELFAGYDYYRFCNAWKLAKLFKPFFRVSRVFFRGRLKKMMSILSSKNYSQLHTNCFIKHDESDLRSIFEGRVSISKSIPQFIDDMYCSDRKFSSAEDAMMFLDMKNYLGNHHVERLDQFTMMHSIEGRFPFLDHNVVEFAATLPRKFKIKRKEQKYILRELSKEYIPEECLSMSKKGFSLPLKEWMKDELKLFVKSHIEALIHRDILSKPVIEKWFLEYKKNRRSHVDIWSLVSLEMWCKLFIDKEFMTKND